MRPESTRAYFAKKIVAVVAALVLAFSLVPAPALALSGGLSAAAVTKGDASGRTVAASCTGKGSVLLRASNGSGASVTVAQGASVRVDAQPAEGYYLAQIRYSSDGGKTFAALPSGKAITVGSADVKVVADFVSKTWDGTVDLTWFDAAAYAPLAGAGVEEQRDYYLSYPAQVAGLAALVNGIFNDFPTTPVLSDADKKQAYKGKTGRAAYLNGATIVRPDVAEDGKNPLDTAHLYATYSSKQRVTSLERDYEVGKERTSTTAVVGDASVLKPLFEHADKNPNSQNLTTTADYYRGGYDFAGKIVHLEADMDFGGVRAADGTWSTDSPLFMPIGGQYCMLPDNGYSKLSSSFCGALDGGGHTMSNLYCERYANTEYGDSQSIGIVGRLGTHDDDPVDFHSVNPAVRDICLGSGLVSGRRSVGGIVGKIGKTTYDDADGSLGAIIENCVNKADVYATDKKGCGGIVGASWNGGIVQNCANLGAVSHVGTVGTGIPTGGIVGSNEITVRSCYSVGPIKAESDSFAMGIGTRNNDFNHYIDNCWWLTGTAAGGGYYGTLAGSGGTGTGSCTEFGPGTSHAALSARDLNRGSSGVWVDVAGVNELGGTSYPALWYQAGGAAGCALEIEQPEHGTLVAESPYAGGRAYSSGDTVPFGITLRLRCEADPGWAVRGYSSNGAALEDDYLTVADAVKVSATVAEAARSRIALPSSDSYTLSVTKDGAALDGADARPVSGYPVASGDVVFEGDKLYFDIQPTDAEPADSNFEYLDTFTVHVNGALVKNNACTVTYEAASSGSVSVSVDRDLTVRSWYNVADVSWYTTHTSDAEYTISTVEQLAGIANLVSTGAADFEGKTIHLAADVTTRTPEGGARYWVPIGISAERAFQGTFDGGGHTVELVDMGYSNYVGSMNFVGLFGYVGPSGVVEGVRLTGDVVGSYYVGGVCGMLDGGTVRDCSNAASVTGYSSYSSDVGGICGYVDGGVIEGCANTGDVSGRTDVGGIAGSICRDASGADSARVEACYSTGAVTGTTNVGGIAGWLQGPSTQNHTTIARCYAAGEVAGAAEGATSVGALFGAVYRNYDVAECVWLDGTSGDAYGVRSSLFVSSSTFEVERVTSGEFAGGAPAGFASEPYVRNASSANNGWPLLPCAKGDAFVVRFTGADGALLDAVAVDAGAAAKFTGTMPVKAPTKAKHFTFSGWSASTSSVSADMTVTPRFSSQKHQLVERVTKKATYAAAGTMRHTCATCGYSYTTSIAKLKVTAKPALAKSKTKSKKARQVTVAWKARKGVTGYQVYAKQGAKTTYKRVSGAKKTSATVKSLASGGTCTVKVRAYAKQAGKFYYGPWSASKKVKVT